MLKATTSNTSVFRTKSSKSRAKPRRTSRTVLEVDEEDSQEAITVVEEEIGVEAEVEAVAVVDGEEGEGEDSEVSTRIETRNAFDTTMNHNRS